MTFGLFWTRSLVTLKGDWLLHCTHLAHNTLMENPFSSASEQWLTENGESCYVHWFTTSGLIQLRSRPTDNKSFTPESCMLSEQTANGKVVMSFIQNGLSELSSKGYRRVEESPPPAGELAMFTTYEVDGVTCWDVS